MRASEGHTSERLPITYRQDALAVGGEGQLVKGAVGRVHDDTELVRAHERSDRRPQRSRLFAGVPLADVEDDGRGHAEEAPVPVDDAGRPAVEGVHEAELEARDGLERVGDDFVLSRIGGHVHPHDAGELGRDRVNDGGLACA